MTKAPPDPTFILRGPEKSPVTCLKFFFSSAGLSLLAAGTQDGGLNIWDVNLKRVVTKVNKSHEERGLLWIDQLDQASGHMVSTGRDGRLVFWSVEEGWQKINDIPICSNGFCGGCLIPRDSPAAHLIAVPSVEESQVDIIDSVTKQCMCRLNPSDNLGVKKYGMCMEISRMEGNQSEILIGYENGSVALWDLRERKMVDHISLYDEILMCLCWSRSGHGWSGSVDNKLTQWSVSRESGFIKLPTIYLTNSGLNHMVLRKDDKILATAGWDSNIRLFGAKKGKPLAVLTHHKMSVKSLAFSDDDFLAAGSQDGSISLWDVYR